jgi:imidazole glycerol-phosphate synthase subunit HisF
VNIRIIPRLDIKGPNLVKGVQFEGLRVLGKPEDFARYYEQAGADELLYVDVVASLYGRNSLLDIVERTAKEIFIPLTVGGGLRSVDDIRAVLRAGADKVAINTAAIKNPELIREASRAFGSSTIVVSIVAMKRSDGMYEAYTDYGREKTGVNALEWAIKAMELGAGELMVTSISREGTGKGFDIEMTREIAESVSIPVIAGGGGASVKHIDDLITHAKVDAVSLASILHYNYIRHCKYNESDFIAEGNVEFLLSKKGNGMSIFQDVMINDIKGSLMKSGIDCRI